MLEFKKIEWSNFLSYGDYVSELTIEGLGQCLITGEVLDDEVEEAFDTSGNKKKKSNGAGKSSLTNVIQWILFGRTMHSASPGNAVVNWFTGKNCWGKITFKDGNSILRTRNTEGHNELLYVKNGQEYNAISTSLSTYKNQQAQLAKDFNLDWDIFCGSVFFNQYAKPWLEMADGTRKKALERLLHVDRFSYYAKVAKDSCVGLNLDVQKRQTKIESLNSDITRLNNELVRIENASLGFIENRKARYEAAITTATKAEASRDAMQLPDLEKLKVKWDLIAQAEDRVRQFKKSSNTILSQISTCEGSMKSLTAKIRLWAEKAGKMCADCEQSVPHQHTDEKIEPFKNELAEKKETLLQLNDQLTKLREKIAATEKLIDEKKPKTSLEDAKSLHARWSQYNNESTRLRKQAESTLKEEDPHAGGVESIKERITKSQEEIKTIESQNERYELLNKHYNYVYKAYNDRSKIKSFIFKEHLPFINSRLRYYLEVFGLDIKIELTDSLGIKSNLWDYKFESGGERKRTDVALMLATFDFHEQMYGRQCNTLVLDEVDGRLDDDGNEALINIIKNDIASKVETVLIISHKGTMHDVFTSEVKIQRKNRMSYISEVLR